MPKSIDVKNLDRRLAERMIRAGQLTPEAWNEHLKSLPDVGEKAQDVETELETGVIEND